MTPVELAPAVRDQLRALADRGALPPRCHDGVIRSAVGGMVRRLLDDDLDGAVRPWHLEALRRRAASLDEVSAARAVSVTADVLVAELAPGGEQIVFVGVDDRWRLVRFADGADHAVRPETSRRVPLRGSGPDAVLDALGLARPDGVQAEYVSEDLGQGETETRHRYRWTEGTRSVLAEEVTTEIFDGATPRSTYVRGVIVEGDHGVLLTGRGDTAEVTQG